MPDDTETNEIELIWVRIDDTHMNVWYPVDEQHPVPGDSYEMAFEPTEGYVMAETIRVIIDDTEYVVQTNGFVPDGEVVPAYDPERNILTIPAELLTTETEVVAIVAWAEADESEEETKPTEETESTQATDPTEVTDPAEATDPTETTDPTAEATDPAFTD